jgi:hypothetical protein
MRAAGIVGRKGIKKFGIGKTETGVAVTAAVVLALSDK